VIGLFHGADGAWGAAFHNGLMAPLFCMLILGVASAKDPLTALLAKPSLRLLGESSYALYILHFPFMILLSSAIYRLDLPLASVQKTIAYILLSIGLSIIAFQFFERPLQSKIRSRLLGNGQNELFRKSAMKVPR